MTALKDIDLSQATVTYNTITFGGSTTLGGGAITETCLPPRFKLSCVEVYDSSGRMFKGLKYTLAVQSIFFAADQATMATSMAALRLKLAKVGGKLNIKGLGLGLETTVGLESYVVDIDGGPKPVGMPEMRMLGENGWELLWAIEFTVNPCYDPAYPDVFVAFNYSTNWSNDFEGRTTRRIQGYYEVLNVRNPASPNAAVRRADQHRHLVTVTCPDGFRRVVNDWHESDNHKRMDFAVVDEQMTGDPYPVGVIEADGDETFQTNPLTWANANVSLNLTYRVAPGVARTVAGQHFLAAAIAKQNAMIALLPAGATVIPNSLVLRNGKYQSANVTSGSISWTLTGCVGDFLSAGGLWARVGDNTYGQWRASIAALGANRGNANVQGILADDVMLDVCNRFTSASLGNDTVTLPAANPADSLSFTCPEVPEDGGWMGYDLRVRVIRDDHQTLHRRAVPYVPTSYAGTPAAGYVPLGGPEYTSGTDEEHVVEYNGKPSVIVVLQFKGMRYRREPVMPEIVTVGGKAATLVKYAELGPYHAGDLMGCPYYTTVGYRIYRVNGYVPTIRKTGSKSSCGDPTVPPSV